jgi:hypothetical protein
MTNPTSQIIVRDEFPFIVDLLTADEAATLAAAFEYEITIIKNDYFPDLSEEDFGSNFIYHESVLMKAIAYRWANSERLKFLAARAAGILSGHNAVLEVNSTEFYIHPIFYLRESKSSHARDERTRNVFLDSQPHYDRSFGVFAFTFWVALRAASTKTGGLAFFEDTPSINDHFKTTWGEKNNYNYEKYVNYHEILDPILMEHVIDPNIKAGQAYLFHSNILHGATKPISATRQSFDFRIIHRDDLKRASSADRELILRFNDDIDLSHCYGLVAMGDQVGVDRHPKRPKLAQDLLRRLERVDDIRVARQTLRWQLEYAWFR